jgi:hypothetical protein
MSHKITDNVEFNKLILGSVRSKVLQKLLIVWYNVFYNMKNSAVTLNAFKRAKEKNPNLIFDMGNVAYSLRPEDIMDMIHVSRRTAMEYIQVFRQIYCLI